MSNDYKDHRMFHLVGWQKLLVLLQEGGLCIHMNGCGILDTVIVKACFIRKCNVTNGGRFGCEVSSHPLEI